MVEAKEGYKRKIIIDTVLDRIKQKLIDKRSETERLEAVDADFVD